MTMRCAGTFGVVLLALATPMPLYAQGVWGPTNLGTFGGSTSFARGINDAGQVVGFSEKTGNTPTHAFLWTASAGMVDLGTLGGSDSQAQAINNAGQVVG